MKVFDELSNQLLDLSKRNLLLNYRNSGKCINVLNKNIEDIFKGIYGSKEYKVILIDKVLERQKKLTDDIDTDIKDYSEPKVYDIISPIIKQKDLILHKTGYLQSPTLKSIYKEYKFSLDEKGINSLYFAFGFITYTDSKDEYKAPIVLIPIDITSNTGDYKIKGREDEAILNPTLEYYFKDTFKITLPKIEMNDEFSLMSYFDSVKSLLKDDMSLTLSMGVGIFSFLKMNMYNDLKENQEIILKNNTVRSLLDLNTEKQKEQYLASFPVVNFDSSQQQAIDMALSGKSFVLQGPPGSGKSQTITNIITSLIGNKKHVLFVSEKIAALNVVSNNLKKVGMEDFTIELHSAKANKKDFIESIYQASLKDKYNIDSNAKFDEDEYYRLKGKLDEYKKLLYTNVVNDTYCLYDYIVEYNNLNVSPLKFKVNNYQNLKLNEIKDISRLFRDYNILSGDNYDYKSSIFYGFKNLSLNYINYDLEKVLENTINYINDLTKLEAKMPSLSINDKRIKTVSDINYSIKVLNDIAKLNYPSIAYFLTPDKVNKKTDEYKTLFTSLPSVINNYKKDVLKLNLDEIKSVFSNSKSFFKRLFSKKYKNAKKELLNSRNAKVKIDTLEEELNSLIEYKNIDTKMNQVTDDLKKILGFDDVRYDDIISDIEVLKDYNNVKVYSIDLNVINDCINTFNNIKNNNSYLELKSKFDETIINLDDVELTDLLEKIKDIYKNINDLAKYLNVISSIDLIKEKGQLDFLDFALKENVDTSILEDTFVKTTLDNKIYDLFDKSGLLRQFDSESFNQTVEDFNKLDERILNLNKDKVIAINSEARPDNVLTSSSPFGILTREANKTRNKKAIRSLMSEISDFILDIKPVFLMSPLSVATYIEPKCDVFDVVIFDEASQIFASDAIGAIYRAKQAIIIGDSKQMPPSNFFSSTTDNEDLEDEIDSSISILDMATSKLPSISLRFHYRSKSEELIQFSNTKFYNDSLITIPTSKMHKEGFGIDFNYIPNGIYDMKSRTNLEEAKYITNLVIEHLKNSSYSLGVVAFSKAQADLIDNLVEKALNENKELYDKAYNSLEPLFVKNLENVQGDERDRIIFSICYGYNIEHKFYQRFGPLNNLGGERRLNVAITRAKYNISIVSSITHSDMRESESLGVNLLKSYLEFAANVEYKKNSNNQINSIVKDLKLKFESMGYTVFTNYGASSFKIHLAVKLNPDSDFVLAVMIDDKDSINKSTIDYYRLSELLLKNNGWKYTKVYAASYFKNKNREIERIINVLNSSEESVIAESDETTKQSYLDVTVKTPLDSLFDNYVEANEDFTSYSASDMIYKIISVEGPIKVDYFNKKIAKLIGKTRVTNVVLNYIKNNMPQEVILNNGSYSIYYQEIVPLRLNSNRSIEEIPEEELKDGIIKIVRYAKKISKSDCFKTLLNLLSEKRLTDEAKKILNNVIIDLQCSFRIFVDGDILSCE